MIISFDNKALLELVTEVAIVKSPVTAGSSVSITLDDNSDLADNDFVLFGEIGKAKSQVAQINAAVVAGVVIQVDTIVFPIGVGQKVYKIPYNQVKLYHAATINGEKTLQGSAVGLDADNEYTDFNSTETGGYFFFTLYNSETTVESDYTPAIPATGQSAKTRTEIREMVKSFYNKPFLETLFDNLCNRIEEEIFAMRRWRFREESKAFNTVAAQQSYTPAQSGISDLGQMIYASYDGDPLQVVDIKTHKQLNWRNQNTTLPMTIWEWDGNLEITPAPPEVKEVKIYYYRNSSGFTNDGTETAVQLVLAISARVASILWLGEDRAKSADFKQLYAETIQAMKANDIKQVSVFHTLGDNRQNRLTYDQTEFPEITV